MYLADAEGAERAPLVCGVLDEPGAELVDVVDAGAPGAPTSGLASRTPRRARFAIERFVLVGCSIVAGGSRTELDVIRAELLGSPIDPEVVRAAGSVSAALAAIAINASNFACVRLNTVWSSEGRASDARCAVLPVT